MYILIIPGGPRYYYGMTGGKADIARRRALGAFYTPGDLALAIVEKASGLLGRPARTVLDPACGDGAFLAAAAALGACGAAEAGTAPALAGVDIDPEAVAAARKRLPGAEIVLGDALDPATLGARSFDLVVGNPPFGLRRDDARVWGLDVNRTDSYAAFLAMGLARLAPGGVLAFITADTWLSIRSHRALRELLLPYLHEVEPLPGGAFDATVNTCLVVLKADGNGGEVTTADGRVPTALIRALPGTTVFSGEPLLAGIVVSGPTRPEEVSPRHMAHVRTLARNGCAVRIVRLGDIAACPHGISTGANHKYVRVAPGTRGTYSPLETGMPAPPDVLAGITDREREHGLDADWERGIGCYVPFDKGGASDSADGWLPNYHVPSPYYLNWASGALADMRRNKGFAWKNWRYFFRPGLTFSVSGVYAPTFRLNAGGVFEAKSSGLFCDALPPELLLGILCSRTARYLFKVFIKHSVDTSGADIAAFPLVLPEPEAAERIQMLVRDIVREQRRDPRYPYHRREQVELDALVARSYGLSDREVAVVDAWFTQRYPRLAAALGPATRCATLLNNAVK